jgi:hypothetical protein
METSFLSFFILNPCPHIIGIRFAEAVFFQNPDVVAVSVVFWNMMFFSAGCPAGLIVSLKKGRSHA